MITFKNRFIIFRNGDYFIPLNLLIILLILLNSCSTSTKVSKPEQDYPKPEVTNTEIKDKTSVIEDKHPVIKDKKPEIDDKNSIIEDKDTILMVASWYGKAFHGHITASGEIFNMNALTAAHKKLPFGTKLLIINPQNEKTTTVTINDRGPYIWGRELDLSYKAASEIGIIGSGTATVRVIYLGIDHTYDNYIPAEVTQETAEISTDNAQFTVQLGTFADNQNADRMSSAVKQRYKNTKVYQCVVNGKKYYKVRVGRLDTKKQAQLLVKNLTDDGYAAFITIYQ